VRPAPDTYVTTGVYTVNQDLYGPRDRSGFELGEPRDSGVYVPIQLGYEPRFGRDQLPGHYVIGFG
jgi:porin